MSELVYHMFLIFHGQTKNEKKNNFPILLFENETYEV